MIFGVIFYKKAEDLHLKGFVAYEERCSIVGFMLIDGYTIFSRSSEEMET